MSLYSQLYNIASDNVSLLVSGYLPQSHVIDFGSNAIQDGYALVLSVSGPTTITLYIEAVAPILPTSIQVTQNGVAIPGAVASSSLVGASVSYTINCLCDCNAGDAIAVYVGLTPGYRFSVTNSTLVVANVAIAGATGPAGAVGATGSAGNTGAQGGQ